MSLAFVCFFKQCSSAVYQIISIKFSKLRFIQFRNCLIYYEFSKQQYLATLSTLQSCMFIISQSVTSIIFSRNVHVCTLLTLLLIDRRQFFFLFKNWRSGRGQFCFCRHRHGTQKKVIFLCAELHFSRSELIFVDISPNTIVNYTSIARTLAHQIKWLNMHLLYLCFHAVSVPQTSYSGKFGLPISKMLSI